jgi:uncharacterized protein involved in exopolysaccharide biosynthesis
MTSQATSLSDLLALLVKEGKRRTLLMASILSGVALAALVIGLVLPKRYDASTLLVPDAPFEPVARTGGPQATIDHAAIAAEFTEGNRILRELLVFGGWVQPPPAKRPDPQEEAKLLTKLRSHIRIDPPKDGIVRISYNDSDPDRTYLITNKLAELYLREVSQAQQHEARAAFDFLDKQVKDYGDKLVADHQEVLAHYRHTDTVKPDPSSSAPAPARPRAAISAAELASLRSEKAALEQELAFKDNGSRSASASPAFDTHLEEQHRTRVAQLQIDLDRLLAVNTEQHPEVQRVKRELAAEKQELARLETARKEAEQTRMIDERAAASLDDELKVAGRARLEEIRTKIALATGSPSQPYVPSPSVPADTKPDPELRGISMDTTLSELLRRYEATRDVYQDLLKRREGARVAMDLAAEHGGGALRVQEPAERPATATGLRLSHFCIAGLLLAAIAPVATLFAIVRFDRRMRSAQQIEVFARVPLLGSIASGAGEKELARERSHRLLAMLMIAGVFAAYVAAFIIKQRTTS